ncbi:MAG: MerR family transcriptional regulator [Thermosipho sp. (in: Bacteria)]|nr:MerR family transcriptional regulator [Thermosipho sp. (in: thermotogales)]
MPLDKVVKKAIINGEEVELYYINELAHALGRTSATIRKWEISGVLPDATFKDKVGRRMYTKEQIDTIVRIAEECRIRQGHSIANTGFSRKVHKALAELNKKYFPNKED